MLHHRVSDPCCAQCIVSRPHLQRSASFVRATKIAVSPSRQPETEARGTGLKAEFP